MRHNFLRVLPPLKNVLPPLCPPGEKKLATPLVYTLRRACVFYLLFYATTIIFYITYL